MTARALYNAGYTDLVSVVPPKARLAPTTGLKLAVRGKAPGKQRIDGTWVGYNFVKDDPPTPADAAKWESWGANIGLHAKHFPAVDVDVDEPWLAELVVQEAQEFLGAAPLRTSREPRRLLVYRTEEPFTRIAATISHADGQDEVEALGEGRQYLVYGDHPSGNKYGWEGKPLWEYSPDELTIITKDDVLEFFGHLQEELGPRGAVSVQGTGEKKDTSAPPQESLKAPDLSSLRDVVEDIPNDYESREDYIQIGHAIKAAGGEEAFDIFLDWCSRWEQGTNEPETVQADWDRMHGPYRVGWPYLQDLAAERSDYNPAQEEFEAALDPTERGDGSPSGGLMELSDTWVVEQVARNIADRVRYVPEVGRYHVWGSG